ncbi:MAG: rhomboid family intramembrane serine protease [Planctomycetota bacterium]|nr:rhomboid family intramembrane serine protease [Planctomycetota bacterium]
MFPFADANPTHRTAIVTYTIILLNVVAFFLFSRLDPETQTLVTVNYGFIPQRIEQLSDPNKIVRVPVSDPRFIAVGFNQVEQQQDVVDLPADPKNIYASLLTCMFMHGGWMHLIGNMWFLFIFGNNIEDRLGHVLYFLFYIGGGLAASATHWAIDPQSAIPVIGASGAVAAVLGAYAVTYPFHRVHTLIFLFVFVTIIDLPALAVLGVWFLGQLLEAYSSIGMKVGGGVAFWAHVGGFVAGAVVMPLLTWVLPPYIPPSVDGPAEANPGDDDFLRRRLGS